MTRPVRRPAARRSASKPPPLGWVLGGVGAASLAAIIVVASLTKQAAVADAVGCMSGVARETLVVAIDTTDPLTAAQPQRVETAVNDSLARLKANDRVAVVEMTATPPTEVKSVVNACKPADENNHDRKLLHDLIDQPIATLLQKIAKQSDSERQSPIIETLFAIASDSTLNTSRSGLHVLLVSDGLQKSDRASVYPRGAAFPQPNGLPLHGVTIELVVLQNPRDLDLQPAGVEALVDYLRALGANLIYQTPPWMAALAQPQHQAARSSTLTTVRPRNAVGSKSARATADHHNT